MIAPFRLLGAVALMASAVAATPLTAQRLSEGSELLKAVRDRDGDKVTEALNRPGSTVVNARDLTTGETALHIVTQRRDLVWIRFLTARGANPNIADRKGVTPLSLAVSLGFVEGVEALLKAGARSDVTNSAGETPLIMAIHRRDPELVRVLLANGADPDRTDNSGRSARDYARLLTGNGQILAELERADATRKGRAAASYGPGL